MKLKPWYGIPAVLLPLAIMAQAPEDTKRLADESRKAAQLLVLQLGGELQKEMESSGPLRSIIVCKYSAPELASSISRKTGWRVSRVSLKPRNPALGMPDTWEQRVLADFDERVNRGEKPETIEFGEIVQEPQGKVYRYMRALPVQQRCLYCHGPQESLTEAVKAQLGSEYPFDKATGYRIGQIRGGVTVKRPL